MFMFLTDLQHCADKPSIIFTTLFSQSFHTTVPSANMTSHSDTIFTLAHLLPLSLAHLPQQKKHHLNLLFSLTKTLLTHAARASFGGSNLVLTVSGSATVLVILLPVCSLRPHSPPVHIVDQTGVQCYPCQLSFFAFSGYVFKR